MRHLLFAHVVLFCAAAVVGTHRGRVAARVAVGHEPEGVATRPDGKVVYVTSEGDGEIDVVAPAADTTARISAGAPLTADADAFVEALLVRRLVVRT